MRKLFLILLITFAAFLIEYMGFLFLGRWWMPDLLILMVIFFSLAWGIRYGLFTAFVAGFVKDSFDTGLWGTNLFSFVLCAYMTILLKKYVYQSGFPLSRLFLILCVCLIDHAIRWVLYMRLGPANGIDMFVPVFLPGILPTLLLSNLVFQELKQCVLKLYGSLS